MKKNLFIKKTALIFGLILTISGLTACGQSTNAKEDAEVATEDVEKVTIKAAIGGGPKPYVFVDDNNEPAGYDIAVLKEVFDRLPQYDLEVEVTDFPSVFAGITSGIYQLGVNNFSYNEKRAESYLYTFPYDKISYVFVTKPDAAPISTFAEAAGKSFEGNTGVSVTTAIEAWNEENADQAINISYTDSDTSVILQHILDGSTEFAIIDKAMFVEYEKEFDFGLVATDVPAEEAKRIADNSYAYFILSLDQTELRDEINGVLKELQEDGTLTKLSQEYFGGDFAPEADQYVTPLN